MSDQKFTDNYLPVLVDKDDRLLLRYAEKAGMNFAVLAYEGGGTYAVTSITIRKPQFKESELFNLAVLECHDNAWHNITLL